MVISSLGTEICATRQLVQLCINF